MEILQEKALLSIKGKIGKILLVLAGLLLGILFSYCNDKEGPSGFAHVLMLDNSFSPQLMKVPESATIEFINVGGNPHNAISADGSWSTEKTFGNLVMNRGQKTKVTYPQKGVYPYYCSFHATKDAKQGMVGTVVVGDVSYETSKTGKKIEPITKWTGVTRNVPKQYPTIQNAVDAANPGDLVLVEKGIYREQVTVTTPYLIIRGVSRNDVILDGEFVRANGIMVMGADGVAIENMTARNYQLNGFFWTSLKGYRGSYLTAYNNGDYGIYAFDSVDGLLENSYASGSPDSGFYIGQCYPCNAVIRDVTAEYNALGYSGTNSGGELYIIRSIWKNNIVGLAPNSLDRELLPPERETTIVANLILDNNYKNAPIGALEYPSFGNGILIPGGRGNRIERNLIGNHVNNGIGLLLNLDDNVWLAHDNIVKDNIIFNSGRADISLSGPMSKGNCFSGNKFRTTLPPLLEELSSCNGIRFPQGSDLSFVFGAASMMIDAADGDFPHGSYKKQPIPVSQPEMPEELFTKSEPAYNVFEKNKPNLANVDLPQEANEILKQIGANKSSSLGILATIQPFTFGSFLYHWIGFLLPYMMFITWVSLSIYDINNRTDLGTNALPISLFVVFLPFIGAFYYLIFGKSTLPKWFRYTIVFGSLVIFMALISFTGIIIARGIGGKQLE